VLLSEAIPNDTVFGSPYSSRKRPTADLPTLTAEQVILTLLLEELAFRSAEEISIEWTVTEEAWNKSSVTSYGFHAALALEMLDEFSEGNVIDRRCEGQDFRIMIVGRFDQE